MTFAVYLPIVICAALAVAAPFVAKRIAPGIGAWLLAGAAAVGACSVLWSLALLVAALVDDVPWLMHGQPPLPVDDAISLAAYALLLWSCVRIGLYTFAQLRLRRRLRAIAGEHVVVRARRRPGHRVRVARPLGPRRRLRGDAAALSADQRRVLFAHEWAHLDARHPAAITLAHLAAAAVPLLRPVARAVGFLCERHADERAAATVADRAGTAAALATAALASSRHGSPTAVSPVCAFDQGYVLERISALRQPVRRPSRTMPAWAVIAVILAVAAAFSATAAFINLTAQFLHR